MGQKGKAASARAVMLRSARRRAAEKLAVQHREPSAAPVTNSGRGGRRSGRRLGEEGVCIVMADVHGCMAETNITL